MIVKAISWTSVLLFFWLFFYCLPNSLQTNLAYAELNHWTSAGPEGGNVYALAIDPLNRNTLYAGIDTGSVIKTTDGGSHWMTSNTGLPPFGTVYTIAIDPSNPTIIYAGTWGVFKSTDAGGNWNPTGLASEWIYALAIDPSNPETLYAGTGNNLYKSTDSGANWNAVSTGIVDRNTNVNALAIDPKNSDILYVGRDHLYKTTDGGANWSLIGSFSPQTISINPLDPNTLYAGTWGDGVFKSTDGGDHWISANTGLTDEVVIALAISPVDPNVIYAGTWNGGVFMSQYGGSWWIKANTGLTGSCIHALVIDPLDTNTVYAGTYLRGVFKTTNGGAHWNAVNAGISYTDVIALEIDPLNPDSLYAAGTLGVLKSTDRGASWNPTGMTWGGISAIAVDPVNSSVLYAAGPNCCGSVMYKSDDGGTHWNLIREFLGPEIQTLTIELRNPNIIYAATSGGIFKSTDGGAYWNLIGPAASVLAIDPLNPGILYAATSGGIFKSTDNGFHWYPMNIGLTNTEIHALAINSSKPNILYAGTSDGGVFKTEDGGAQWNTMNDGLPQTSISLLVLDQLHPHILYAAAERYGVFVNRGAILETISVPTSPIGQGVGAIGKSYSYVTGGSSSNLGHPVEYQFEWKGDGSDLSNWGSATQSTVWTVAGAYNVRARARCATDISVVSNWSNPLSVSISLPAISVTPLTYDFGNVEMKKSKTASFKVKNNGTADLLISTSITGADVSMFTITSGGGSKTIKPNKTLTIKVVFKPTSTGPKSSTLRITSNDPDTPTIDILLTGTGPFSAKTPDISVVQTALDFGRIKVGKKITKTLKIMNNSSRNLVIMLSGLEGTDFSIQGSGSVTIKAKKSYSLKVLFTPKSVGLETATLEVNSNDLDSPSIDISLSGTGH